MVGRSLQMERDNIARRSRSNYSTYNRGMGGPHINQGAETERRTIVLREGRENEPKKQYRLFATGRGHKG